MAGDLMRHLWIQAAKSSGKHVPAHLLLPPVDVLRPPAETGGWPGGPYVVAAAIAHALVPGAARRRPDLVAAYDIELRTVAPALRDVVPARRVTISAELPPAERILVHAARRTLRISNGLAEFLQALLQPAPEPTQAPGQAETAPAAPPRGGDRIERLAGQDIEVGDGPRVLVVENADAADFTDRELLAVLLRRLDPREVTLVVCATGPATGDDPLHEALAAHAAPVPVAGTEQTEQAQQAEQGTPPPAEPPPDLVTMRETLERWFEAGCHHAVARLGARALALCEPGDPGWWRLMHRTATSLGAIGREEDARALFDQVRRHSTDPAEHAAAAYSTGMLLVRHHDPARRDLDAAMAWVNEAIAISRLLPDPAVRAFKLGFDLNGRALIETRLGRPREALALVEEAIELADNGLAPGAHPIHRLVLRANRAHLLAALGRPGEALADLDAAIAADPGHPDYYIDRGNLLYALGRHDDAVADYETAMRAGPPFPEPYYNRAEVRFAAGDLQGALADLGHALDLDPDFTDAYVNRAGLLVHAGEYARARADAERGLRLAPGNPHLLCVLGQVEMAERRPGPARSAFDDALALDPALAAAWANRGILAFETGDVEGAVRDLTRALELDEQPPVLFNRAMALRAAGREQEARADLTRALELDPRDDDIRHALSIVPAPARPAD
jgi:tetratricopeptide (TPR) repeat protein